MRYKTLGDSGVRVSELVLGTGMFGTTWGYGAEPDTVRSIIDGYAEAGGNFIDTADFYNLGEAEQLIGEAIKNERDHFLVGTKYSFGAGTATQLVSSGNSRKAMIHSVEQSLRRLQTDRIDLLWVHIPDGVTPIDEIVMGLDLLARSGKILYAGLSNFPAWRISRAVTIAELRGLLPIVAIQSEYSLIQRGAEKELIPMANAYGMGMLAWSPLGGGLLTGKYRRDEPGRATVMSQGVNREDNAQRTAIIDALLQVAGEVGASASEVAIAWVLGSGCYPIIGPRTAEQLKAYLNALTVTLTGEQQRLLDQTSSTPLGTPHEIALDPDNLARTSGGKFNLVKPGKLPR